ncbi:S1C family serine protease [Paenibacillus paeoniae]|uniref:Peptidase S1 n=1 Tax=Paenibacillus paeoniae TaxID=2292705 RepID=A0A371P606_9BACL|nr:trypsin-like peptidase domain-containing protein [Paenibacillus paeoniae]REK71342.1 peptidase S1 [Paenibacillus paeoniae]
MSYEEYGDKKTSGHDAESGRQLTVPQFEAYYREVNKGRSSRKKNAALPLFAAFLTGALVIGGLTYSADRNNLFTGGLLGGTSASGVQTSNGSGQDSGLATASMNTKDDMAAIYEKASPAVVKIENYGKNKQQQGGGMMADPWLEHFFGGQGSAEGNGNASPKNDQGPLVLSGSGTGFFFDKEGLILTNEHVVSGASEVKVQVQGYDEPLTAKVLGTSYDLDLAVLKVEHPSGGTFPSLKLGDSNETRIGDWVLAIGNPYGFDHTLTMGVLSAKERPITIQDEQGSHKYEHLLQTDASINPGNSGGPLLNAKGEVIGMNTAVNAEAQGIGFAIPTTTIMDVLDQLKGNTL